MPEPFQRITAYHDIIYPRYDPKEFVGRGWLVEKVKQFRDSETGRHLVIVGEPGSGKSTFVAYLAERWNCPRHFIRTDNIGGVTGVDPRAFLLSVGAQIYQKFGREIFEQRDTTKTRVNVGLTKDQAEVVGRMIDEMYSLPFLPQQQREVEVRVVAATGASRVVGERVKRMYDVTLALEESTLLHVAVIQPLQRIKQLYPQERVLLLIDALDESMLHPGMGIVDVIPSATDTNIPNNLRLVMTSRPGRHLVRFREKDQLRLDDKEAGHWKETLNDARTYIEKNLSEEPLKGALAVMSERKTKDFIEEIEKKSDGNFLYLFHFLNTAAEVVNQGESDLENITVPAGLDEIYRFFAVERIRKKPLDLLHFTVDKPISKDLQTQWQSEEEVVRIIVREVEVTIMASDSDPVLPRLFELAQAAELKISDLVTQRGTMIGTWEEKYLPVLGVLAVALEMLSRDQLATFAGVEVEYVDSILAQLLQFLDIINDDSVLRYRLYHRDFAEYLLDQTRNQDWPLDGPKYHYQIASNFRGKDTDWHDVDWSVTGDPYAFHHLAEHLMKSGKKEQLHELIDRSWMMAHYDHFGSFNKFSADVWLSVLTAGEWEPPKIVEEFRGSVIVATLGTVAGSIPSEVLGALTSIGEADKAMGHASLIHEPLKRCETYTAIAKALVANNDLRKAIMALDHALTSTQSIPNEFTPIRKIREIANLFAELGEIEKVREIADMLGSHKWNVLQNLSFFLAEGGQIEEAINVIEELPDYYKGTAIYLVANRELEMDPIDELFRLFENLPGIVTKVNAACGLAFSYARKGDLSYAGDLARAAHEFSKEIEDRRDRVTALCDVVEVLVYLKEFSIAMEAANRAFEAAADTDGNQFMLEMVSKAFVQVKDFDRAIAIVKGLRDDVELFSISPFTNLALIFHLEEEFDRFSDCMILANEVVESWIDTLGQNQMDENPFEISWWRRVFISLQYISEANAKAGNFQKALLTAESIEDREIRAAIFGLIAQELEQCGKVSRATDLTHRALQISQTIPPHRDDWKDSSRFRLSLTGAHSHFQWGIIAKEGRGSKKWAMRNVAEGLALVGRIDQGLTVAKSISDPWHRITTFLHIANALIFRKEHAEAYRLLVSILSSMEDIPSNKHRAIALNFILRFAIAASPSGLPSEFTDDLITITKGIQSEEAKRIAISGIIDAISVGCEFDQVGALTRQLFQLAETIEDTKINANALKSVVNGLVVAEEYDEALKVAESIEDADNRVSSLGSVVDGLLTAEKYKKALKVVDLINPEDFIFQPFNHKERALGNISVALVEARKHEWAMHVAERITTESERVRIYPGFAQALFKSGELARARSVAELTNDNQTKAFILLKLGSELAKSDQWDQAFEICELGLKSAEKIENEKKVNLVIAVIREFDEYNEIVTRLNLPNIGLLAIAEIPDERYRMHALIGLTEALASAQQLDLDLAKDAMKLALDLDADKNSARAVNELLSSLIMTDSLGEKTGLIDWLQEITEYVEDDQVRLAVLGSQIHFLIETGEFERALKLSEASGENSLKVYAICQQSRALAAKGMYDEAIAVAETLQHHEIISLEAPVEKNIFTEIAEEIERSEDRPMAIDVWRKDLAAGSRAGREAVYRCIGDCAVSLAVFDEGETLWQIYEAIQAVEQWWE